MRACAQRRPSPTRLRSSPSSTIIAALAFCVGGCRSEDHRAVPQLTTRDSSGVEIAEIAGDPWSAPPWASLDTANATRIEPDESRPETLFGRVRGTLRLADGRIAVLDVGRYAVQIFAPDGTLIRSIGRQGQGPGEFEAPWRLVRAPADSLGVVDISGRIELLAITGEGSRRITMPRGSETGSPQVLGSFAGGGYLAILNEFPGKPRPGVNPLFSTLHVVTADGASGPTLGRYKSAQFTFRDRGDGQMREIPTLFWAEPGMAVLPAGYVWCLATNFECQIWSNTAVHLRTIRAPVVTAAVTEADVGELKQIQLAKAATARDSAQLEASMLEANRMERFPVLSLIRTDPRGRIWMRAYSWRDADRTVNWLVLEPTGHVLGTVTMPTHLQVFDIGHDYILGVERDADDAEGIVMYPYRLDR